MSGTAYGTVVLHVSPEPPQGGPLGLVAPAIRLLGRGRPRLFIDIPQQNSIASPGPATVAGFAAPSRGWDGCTSTTCSRPIRG